MGRQASPDKKPIKTVQLYKSKSTLVRYQRKKKRTLAPGGQNTCRNWPIHDNRHHQASVRPARNGYPQDRPPQILIRKPNELHSPYSLFSRCIITPQPASNGSFREGMSLTRSDSFCSTTLSSRRLVIWFLAIRIRLMRR